jgi:predicted anti-sigma-YlaC factor YlaD
MNEWIACEQDERISELMSLALDGLLNADAERDLHRHLAACPTCQAEWRAMQQLSALFQQSPAAGPPLGFAIRVDRRLAEQENKRRQKTFGGLALLTGSLSLAGVTAAAVILIVVGLLVWHAFGSVPAVQEGAGAVSQVAEGMGLVGKGATLFLKDLLLRYGPPLLILVGIGLAFLAGIWAWLYSKRPGRSHHNGYV